MKIATDIKIAIPGDNTTHGYVWIILRPLLIILPHSAMAIAAILGGGIQNAVIALAVVSWPKYSRIARGQTLALKEEPYIHAAILAGDSSGKARHISEILIITVSAAPPKYPQHTPTAVPNTKITATRIKVEKILALAFPGLVFAMAIAAILGGGIQNAVIALAVVSWPKYPQHTPTAVPNTKITATRIKVEKILALAPLITLDSISLPYVSVPIGC